MIKYGKVIKCTDDWLEVWKKSLQRLISVYNALSKMAKLILVTNTSQQFFFSWVNMSNPLASYLTGQQWTTKGGKGVEYQCPRNNSRTKPSRIATHNAQHMRLPEVKPGWRALERQPLPSGQVLFGKYDYACTTKDNEKSQGKSMKEECKVSWATLANQRKEY